MSSLSLSPASLEEIPAWLRELCDRLQSNEEALLTVVNLNLTRFNLPCMVFLCQGLKGKRTPLHSLNLTSALVHNNLPIGIVSSSSSLVLLPLIVQVLPKSSISPRQVHLSYNRLEGPLNGIGHALTMNETLTELHLDHNQLTCNTAEELAQGLKANTTLRVLELSCNLIGDHGATVLARALRANSSLRTLGLARNRIGTVGGEALEKTLWVHKNTTLKKLHVQNNPEIPIHIAEWIAMCCQANMLGRSIWLDPNLASLGVMAPLLCRCGSKSAAILFLFLQESCHARHLLALVSSSKLESPQDGGRDGDSEVESPTKKTRVVM